MSRRPRLGHRAEYAAYAGVSALTTVLGTTAAEGLGAALGRFARRPLGVRRRVTEENIRRAFPERDEAWVRELAAASYAHLGREAMAMLRLPKWSPRQILDALDIEPALLRRLADAAATGRGVVIATGHFGNWEMAGAYLAASGYRVSAYYRRMANPLVDREVRRTREALGLELLDVGGDSTRRGLERLAAGGIVAVVADQDARGKGAFVPFFGRPASTPRGAAMLALRGRAPLFIGYARRGAEGRYVGHIEEVEASREGDVEAAVHRLTAAFTARLEAAVREAPEQYFWQHRRWKTAPPEEPGRAGAV